VYIPVIEESVFRLLPDAVTQCVFGSELEDVGQRQAGECCVQVCEEGECRHVGGGNKACRGGLCIKVLCCSEEAFRGETVSPDISKVKRETVKSEEFPARAISASRGDGDRFTCNGGHL